MIDREARNKLAEKLRQFEAGRITNDELCELAEKFSLKTPDATLAYIADVIDSNFEGKTFRTVGKYRPTPEQRREVARISLYLYTYLEDPAIGKKSMLRAILAVLAVVFFPVSLALGLLWATCAGTWRLIGRLLGRPEREDLWPFLSREEYEEALKHPKLLRGKKAA